MATRKKVTKKGPRRGTKYKGTNPYTFGKTLAYERRKKGLSQEELGHMIGVSKRAISYYERELINPTIELIHKVSKAVKVSPNIFLDPGESQDIGKDDHRINRKLKKAWEQLKTLSPKAQKSLQEYIEMLVKNDAK